MVLNLSDFATSIQAQRNGRNRIDDLLFLNGLTLVVRRWNGTKLELADMMLSVSGQRRWSAIVCESNCNESDEERRNPPCPPASGQFVLAYLDSLADMRRTLVRCEASRKPHCGWGVR